MSWYDPSSWDAGDWTDVGAAFLTGGASIGFSGAKKAANAFVGQPDLVNSAGSKLSDEDKDALAAMTPAQRAIDMRNWLTAGGPPKPVDPGQIFAEDQIVSPQVAKASAGMGINGLFGVGKYIGDIAPLPQVAPLNLSPMQPGVPYSAPPIPKDLGTPR